MSNGQKARAHSALLMTLNEKVIVIDEWTSVVDRTVAKAMSHCIQKYAKKKNKKIILCTCHYDIIDWINPEWLIDCNEQTFKLRENEDFFFKRRDKLKFDIKPIGRKSWKYFSKYHYLSENLPGGDLILFGLFCDNKQIGFQCFANYTPHRKGTKKIYHSNRTVIHPDYNGLGLGIMLINKTSEFLIKSRKFIKIMAKFSSVPIYKSMIKQKEWVYLKSMRMMKEMPMSGNMHRREGYREKGVKTYHFQYVGNK